ncbi:MAG: NADH-quinone oxidoreductase subunit C [Bdellovibrionota bacterium]
MFPSQILETRKFGRAEVLSAWIELGGIRELASGLVADPELRLDWLENLSVIQMDSALVINYFLRSSATPERLILRGSVVPASPNEEVEVPSVREAWPMAEAMENENGELFGVRFTPAVVSELKPRYFPDGWSGFPLRKTFVFPKEVIGITHSRPAGRK